MKVLVLAEHYPRADGPLPSLSALRRADLGAARRALQQPASAQLDGTEIDYLRYLSPPRPWSYAHWGAWAAPLLRRALRRIRVTFPFNLIHAHYAVPSGDAVRRAAPATPLVVSVHGGDVLGAHAGAPTLRPTLGHATRLVLANSAGTGRRCQALGAAATQVIHLGTELAASPADPPADPVLVSVGNLIGHKRHADVIEAVALLAPDWPALRHVIVGGSPEREALLALAEARGVSDREVLRGRLNPADAVVQARAGSLFVMPSVAEAFGVAYVEAMAAGVPAIGCAGEDGPEEIAAAGGGIELVPPRNPRALTGAMDGLLRDPARRAALSRQARETVAREFTWKRCGDETVAAYEEVLRG